MTITKRKTHQINHRTGRLQNIRGKEHAFLCQEQQQIGTGFLEAKKFEIVVKQYYVIPGDLSGFLPLLDML